MHTGDILALGFFLPGFWILPGFRLRNVKYLNFVLNIRRVVNNTQHGLSTFLTLPVPSLLVPTPDTGGSAGPPAYFKNCFSHEPHFYFIILYGIGTS